MTFETLFNIIDRFEINSLGLSPAAFAIVNNSYLNDDIVVTEDELLIQVVNGLVPVQSRTFCVLNYVPDPPEATTATNVDNPDVCIVAPVGGGVPGWFGSAFGIYKSKVQFAVGVGVTLSVGPTPGVCVDSMSNPVAICLESGNFASPTDVFIYNKIWKI